MAKLLQIAGVVHSDPLGKECLAAWLIDVKSKNEGEPAFVAVEYDQNIFIRLKNNQRPILERMLRDKWPDIPSDICSALVEAIGYEAETSLDIFPNIDTLWLTEGQPVCDMDINEFAKLRLKLYQSVLLNENYQFTSETLDDLSVSVWKRAEQGGEDHRGDIDRNFAERIQSALDNNINNWAVVIVGENHTLDKEGTMTHILRNSGFDCAVISCRPSKPPAKH